MSILLTGATGYIGGLVLRRLEADGRSVRCLVRDRARLTAVAASTEVVEGDCLDERSLDRALAGLTSAYYLVHSMGSGADFAERDRRAAANFGRAAARAGIRRIIYLGGLTDDSSVLSAHLKSRAETGETLRASGVPVIEFRASVVIGAGSLSFQMIQALVERLPVMICPRWVSTLTQPIAVADVLEYLHRALEVDVRGSATFEIGGPDVVSYGDMMRAYARLQGLRRLLIPVPLLTPHLSGLWLALVTPAQARVGRALVEGLKNATVVHSNDARDVFGVNPVSLDSALQSATDEGQPRRLRVDSRTMTANVAPERAFVPVRRIGGSTGWYFGQFLWEVRGRLDKSIGGVGLRRGRRDPDLCERGDVIDCWTVERLVPGRLLRLSADMKMPGRGWLEFEVTPVDGGRRSSIRQTASFDPRGLLGRAYWLALLPFHAIIFRGMLRRIVRIAEQGGTDSITVADVVT